MGGGNYARCWKDLSLVFIGGLAVLERFGGLTGIRVLSVGTQVPEAGPFGELRAGSGAPGFLVNRGYGILEGALGCSMHVV